VCLSDIFQSGSAALSVNAYALRLFPQLDSDFAGQIVKRSRSNLILLGEIQ
jgi:hypothetical protein